jgi:hypothetical protein
MAGRLVGGGIPVGEFAKVPVSLADLIEGLVRKGGVA